jgi:hypothetical protein
MKAELTAHFVLTRPVQPVRDVTELVLATLTSIDDDKTRDRLETDQTGRCKLPGIVAFVQPVRIGLCGDVERHDEETDRFFSRPTKQCRGK